MRINFLFLLLLVSAATFAQGTGEIIITEYYNRPLKPSQAQLDLALPNNPAGADVTPNEGHTEWFEVYNTTSSPVVMDGWTLTDASSSSNVSTIGSFTLAANSYATFSGFNIPDAQGGVQFDYFYDYKKPSFNNESSYQDVGDSACPDGVIIAKGDGTLVDEVRFDYGYGNYIGNPSSGSCTTNTAAVGIPASGSSSKISFMLNVDPAVMNSADNDLAVNWSFSTLHYDVTGNQRGTPGLANDGSLPPGPADFGTGEIIITEYYNRPLKPTQEQLDAALPNNPAGADVTPNEGHTEWFEIYNTTSSPVVMDGWTLTDASSSSNVSTIGSFTLAANSYASFTGFNIPDAQGGVQFDYFYDYKKPSFNNESSYQDVGDSACPDGVIIAKADGTLVDEVRFDYGYGNYIGNPSSGSCTTNTAATGIPSAGSSSKVSFMLNVDPAVMNSADNDLAANWSFSTIQYDVAGNQTGTPGLANDASAPPACSMPENISHALMSPAALAITWDAHPEALRYDVHYRVSGTSAWTRRGALNNYCTLRYLAPNTSYEYRVRSYCGTWDFANNATGFLYFNTANTPMVREGFTGFGTAITSLSPNPARDVLNVEFSTETKSDVTLSVVDMMGKVISQNNIANVEGLQNETIDVSNLGQGYYMLVMQSNDKRVVEKFVTVR